MINFLFRARVAIIWALVLNLFVSMYYEFWVPEALHDEMGLWGYSTLRTHLFNIVGIVLLAIAHYSVQRLIRKQQLADLPPTDQVFATLAEQFHDAYERLAPDYGYTTRLDTRSFDPKSRNGLLMIATIRHLADAGIILVPGYQSNQVYRWVFDEDPGELAGRLELALQHFGGNYLAAVRNVFIEQGVSIRLTPKEPA